MKGRVRSLVRSAISFIRRLPPTRVEYWRKHPKTTVWVGIAVVITLVIVFTAFAETERVQYLLQLFSGNWNPPKNFSEISRLEFAITALFAIAINWIPLIGAFALVYGFMKPLLTNEVEKERFRAMKLKEAFDAREEATKLALLDEFPDDEETINKINKAFVLGGKAARDHLIAAFGERETEAFLRSLDREIPKEPT